MLQEISLFYDATELKKFCPSCVAGTFCSAVFGSMCSGALTYLLYIPSDNEEMKCLRTGCYGYNNDFLTFAYVLTDTRSFQRRKRNMHFASTVLPIPVAARSKA